MVNSFHHSTRRRWEKPVFAITDPGLLDTIRVYYCINIVTSGCHSQVWEKLSRTYTTTSTSTCASPFWWPSSPTRTFPICKAQSLAELSVDFWLSVRLISHHFASRKTVFFFQNCLCMFEKLFALYRKSYLWHGFVFCENIYSRVK